MKRSIFSVIIILDFTSFVYIKTELPEVVIAEIASYQLNNVDTLVDIGCQDGLFSREVAKYYPNTYLILEDLEEYQICSKGGKHCINQNTFKRVKKRFKKAKKYPNIESRYQIIAGKADSIPLHSDNYGRILCRKTLHEFQYRDKMVDELYRILKPNGILTIVEAEPNTPGQTDIYCNKKYLTKEEVLAIMGKFKLVDIKTFDYNVGNLLAYNFTK